MKRNDYIHVFSWEFLICDVAQGLNGIPLFCLKGILLSEGVIIPPKKLGYPIFLRILI